MEEEKKEVTKTENKSFSISFSADMLFVLISLAILATFALFRIIMNFAYNDVVSDIFAIIFLSAAVGNLGLNVLKFRTLNLEVVLSMVVAFIIL